MNSSADDRPHVVRTGIVVRRPFGVGSRSEHVAVSLQSDEGVYKLRRMGRNVFKDPELEKLVGKRLRATGVLYDSSLIMVDWALIGEDSDT